MSPLNRLRTALFLLAAPALVAGALVAGCGKPGKPPQTEKQNPMWSQYITAHTSGLVSRHATVRVVFASDVAERDQIGKSASHLLDVDPGIDGKALFSGPREISLTPDQPLEPGAWYRVRVRPGKVMQLPKDLTRYEFTFQVVKPDLGVQVAGLNVAVADDGTMVLNGAVDTADAEDPQAVEKIVLARLDDQDLKTDWIHLEGGKRHEFKVAGIARTERARSMKVAWSGQPIGVDKKGEQVVEVPAVTAFDVTQVQSMQKPSQHIAVAFSDNLDPHQSLEGLVETTQGIGSMRIEGNELKIFPEKRFTGQVTATLDEGVRNSRGTRLGERVERAVTFTGEPPQVRFVGKGVILPENTVLSIPFEAVNVRSVQVTAFRIWESNLGQFLQSNDLDGRNELDRVGRPIWTKTIHVPALKPDTKGRYNLDVTELLRANPGGMFQLNLFITRANSSYPCTGEGEQAATPSARGQASEDLGETEGGEYSPEDDSGYQWQHRDDPCKDAYYSYAQGVRDARNLLASNIGLLAKRDRRGTLHVVATNLRTGEPGKGVALTLFDYQNQPGLTASTDASGFAEFKGSENAFYVLAEQGGGKGYLKLYSGSALPVSHFDVGGETVARGIKSLLYGERGVWRPGDDIHLTFVLQDKEGSIPANHPVTVTLHNPQGQLMQTVTNGKPTGGFYAFTLKTDESAPTGNWTAKAQLGPNQFSTSLKIETVRPDRLKVELELRKDVLYRSDMPFKGKVVAQWLHGAVAGGLKTDVALRLTPTPTRFDRYKDFVFDDPARSLNAEPRVLLDGELDENGRLEIEEDLLSDGGAPGAVRAQFTTRVFERGGAFSTAYSSATLYPYDQFVGVQMPKSERSWGMLPTDKTHTVSIATVDARGKPVSLKRVKVSLYRIGWRWWWDRTEDSLASFASGQHSEAVQEGEIDTRNGQGQFKLEIRSPNWGRYLLRACDPDGGHCTGSVFYMDSPGWAAWAQEEGGAGASVLSFFSDKPDYKVGETAVIQLPEASQGRALLTLENGTGLLEKRWIELSKDRIKFEVPITAAMSPNVYVSVALIQPHQGKDNDRPIRLYGVIPLRVQDPDTVLAPAIKTAEEWRPESKVAVEVTEAKGREMTYTLAVVDEGLLTLTSYKTPDLRAHFYKREALGVTTWDLFDYVVGAYGGELERLLALGGDEEGGKARADAKEERRRFPPVVTFLGPFKLGAKATAKHEIALPQYIGAVRVMVVAGERGAYGSADKTVPVRQPLSLLATLPRVLGPDEEVGLPVSLFVMDAAIKTVQLKVEPDSHFEVVGKDTVQVAFAKPGEQLGMLKLKVKPHIGKATVRLTATSGQHVSRAEVNIDIRSPNPRTAQLLSKALQPGETWSERVLPHGLPGTNEVSLEVYSVLPFRMEKHLDYLVQYPHGCLEQTTSSVFPQLYLPTLMNLEDWRKKEIERNIRAGVERLRLFQQPGGGFSYWPGERGSYNGWASSYAGHFLVEAEQLGYFVPRQMILDWASQQKGMAQAWNGKGDWSELEQAYRLYTLALAKQPALGAMNRMREMPNLHPVARLQLAAAYKLAGQNEAAAQLAQGLKHEVSPYAEPGPTFGSPVRDKGIILSSLVALGDLDSATRMAKELSEDLSAEYWYSTQTLAYALVGLGRMAGAPGRSATFGFEANIGKAPVIKVRSDKPLHAEKLKDFPQGGEQIRLRNTSDKPIYAYVVMKGAPPAGAEQEGSEGLGVSVDYLDTDGSPIDVEKLTQSTDLMAKVVVTNRTGRWLENVALTHIVPSGWEIHNARLAPEETDDNERVDYRDIRDDRVYTYFRIGSGQKRTFTLKLNAAYLGRYYLPSVTVEPMYEATKFARTKGQWVEVVKGK
jgi:hypothetical protein